ncbi:MAG: serine/threonine-protein phosphatase [Phycisphaerales bacterium]|nr:serine/threonine-protein phosphatase [Phycisphaerales bacterium]
MSGHGASVSQISSDLRSLMRRYINFVDQRKFVHSLNNQFRGIDESGHFATAVVATCWTPTDEVTITCAGHPSPLCYRAETGKWSALLSPGGAGADIPLGLEKGAMFQETRLHLGADDLVLLYTDGLVEAKSPTGALLGGKGLLALLASLDATTPERLLEGLVAAVSAFQGGAAPDDDLTLMLLRPNALKPKASLMTGIIAGKRVARGVVDAMLGRGPTPVPQMNRQNFLGAFIDRFNRSAKPPPPG